MMADWSQLLPELVVLIAKRLEVRFDIVRFRSICSSWRSCVPPPEFFPCSLPTHLPPLTSRRWPCSLSRNTFYLIKRTHDGNQEEAPCWVAKFREGTHMLAPFFDFEFKPLPPYLPKLLDLSDFQVFELGHEYIGRYDGNRRMKFDFLRTSTDDFIMASCMGGMVAVLRLGENEWTFPRNPNYIEDIISFNGKFYAVGELTRIIVIDESLNVSLLGPVGTGSDYTVERNYLVKSVDDLLVVQKCSSVVTGEFGDVYDEGFRVFRLNEEEKKWDEMDSLGDRILFLGSHHSISAPASEFGLGRGNLICFPPDEYDLQEFHEPQERYGFVFDFETGQHCPAYSNLFIPPSQWFTAPESEISSQLNSIHSIGQ